jgi:intracellular septation protein A
MRMIGYMGREFGPLLAFLILNSFIGLKPAIAVSLVWTIVEVIVLVWSRSKPTTLFVVSSSVAICFGILDLSLSGPFFLKIEVGVVNSAFAAMFGLSLFRERSVIQEIAERRERSLPEKDPEDRKFFFRCWTAIWCSYYLVRAIVFTSLNFTSNFPHSLLIRTGLGTVSFWALLGTSIFLSRPLWRLLVHLEWMPSTRVPLTEAMKEFKIQN